MIREYRIGRDLDEALLAFFDVISQLSDRRSFGKPRNTSVRRVGVLAEIRNKRLLNSRAWCCRYKNLFRKQ
jgi:hypothetical protein